MRRVCALSALATVASLASVGSARAIEVCYDYAIYRLTGTDPRPPGSDTKFPYPSNRDELEKALKKAGYEVVTPRPSGRELKPDDVVLVPGHVGYVNAPNAIDHFVQREGTTIRTTRNPNPTAAYRYPANYLPGPLQDENGRPLKGGYFEGDTLDTFLTRPLRPQTTYEVWRKKRCELGGTWAFNVPALGSSTFTIDSKGATQESGMGNSRGTSKLNGGTLTYTWTTGAYEGNVVINLNESCTEGRGTVTWTKYPPTEKRGTSFPATLIRSN